MNEKNFDYLTNQVKFTGFGDDLHTRLRDAMLKNEPAFTLTHLRRYGKDDAVSTLHFKKSETTDLYFFNKYNLILKTAEHPHPVKQTFYLNNEGESVTLKEAYNLLSGRAVHKELSNREGVAYKAWLQLDFNKTDKLGNYEVRQFHQHYGYDLHNELGKHAIADMRDEASKLRLINSLERGNRQMVTIDANNTERKIFIEAAPQYKTLNFYNEHLHRINAQEIYNVPRLTNGTGQPNTEPAVKAMVVNEPSNGIHVQKPKQHNSDPDPADEDGPGKPGKRQRKRRGMSA